MSRLYIGNLDPRVNERELEDEFRTFGTIRSLSGESQNHSASSTLTDCATSAATNDGPVLSQGARRLIDNMALREAHCMSAFGMRFNEVVAAQYGDDVDALQLDPDQQKKLHDIVGPPTRQRSNYWSLASLGQEDRLRSLRNHLAADHQNQSSSISVFSSAFGESSNRIKKEETKEGLLDP